MKIKILFVERKFHIFFSLEKVFRQIAKSLNQEKFEIAFQQLPHINNLSGMLRNFISYRRPKADIYHITGHIHYIALIFPPKKTVLTIHDLAFLHTRAGIRRFLLKKLLLDFPLRRLRFITAVSEATKNEIIGFKGSEADKIRVIENPVDELFFDPHEREFNTGCPTILQIGAEPHKNLPNLIKAVEGIDCRLVVIGKLTEELLSLLKEKQIKFENKYNLDDRDVLGEYQKADVVAFCSFYEGFGLPIVEAQAMGTPVVTSDIEPMRGVAGEGAYLADPNDFSSIRAGIRRIIDDKMFRENLIQKGLKNVERFRPEKIAARYEALYEEMLSAKS